MAPTTTTLTNQQALNALNSLRRFGHEVKAPARLKYHLALIAAALAPHIETVGATQQQLQKDFLGDDPSQAQPPAVLAFNKAIATIMEETASFTFEPISDADFDGILALPELPCAIEPLLVLRAPARAPDPAAAGPPAAG